MSLKHLLVLRSILNGLKELEWTVPQIEFDPFVFCSHNVHGALEKETDEA